MEDKKLLFGTRLRAFRKVATLSQHDFATFMDTGKAYISDLEKGVGNPSLDILMRYAAFFGVEYYELGNPKFPVPTFGELPAASRKAINFLKKQQEEAKIKAEELKAANKEEGIPGRAKQLHGLIATGFFKQPKTAKDAFIKLNPGTTENDLTQHGSELGKITVTLGQGRFAKLLDKLEPAPGSNMVRFVGKDPSVIKYLNEASGSEDIAADGL